jgi:hypothetical protein
VNRAIVASVEGPPLTDQSAAKQDAHPIRPAVCDRSYTRDLATHANLDRTGAGTRFGCRRRAVDRQRRA